MTVYSALLASVWRCLEGSHPRMRTSDLLSGTGATDLVLRTPAKSTARLPGAGIASFWVLRGRPVFEAGGALGPPPEVSVRQFAAPTSALPRTG